MTKVLFIVFAILINTPIWSEDSGKDRISLEEVTVQLTEDEKVKETHNLRQLEAHEWIRQRKEKGLGTNEKILSKKLDKPKLRFFDKEGKLKKEIILGTEISESTLPTKDSKKEMKVKIVATQEADVSSDGQYAVVWKYKGEPGEGDGRQSGSWFLVNKEGDSVIDKQLPRFKMPATCKFSGDGSKIVVIEVWTKFHHLSSNEPLEQVVIYEKTGREAMRFPASRDEKNEYRLYGGTSDLVISPSGRYVAIKASKNRSLRTVFLDIEKKTTWEFEKPSYPIDIDDSGKARVSLLTEHKIENLDLKKFSFSKQ